MAKFYVLLVSAVSASVVLFLVLFWWLWEFHFSKKKYIWITMLLMPFKSLWIRLSWLNKKELIKTVKTLEFWSFYLKFFFFHWYWLKPFSSLQRFQFSFKIKFMVSHTFSFNFLYFSGSYYLSNIDKSALSLCWIWLKQTKT